MNTGTTRGLVIGLATVLTLAGCEDGNMPGFLQPKAETGSTTTSTSRSTKTVERDVEAPEVFQVTDRGLWDGRPSLGGVWVAHPDAKDPERVIIRNPSNNKFVVGVLYRPERQQPGPRFQVSSDAADALGMLAGAPTDINVTALRRETVEEAPAMAEAPAATAPTTTPGAPPAVAATTLDPISAASAALDAAEGKPTTSAAAISAGSGASAAAPAAPTRATPASNLSKPFIQIGIFSVKANADNTAESLRQAGMVPTVKPGKMSGKDFWRVIVGPATSNNERSQLLKKIKDLGFNDAYYVTN